MKLLVSSCLLGQNVRYDGGNCPIDSGWISELKAKGKIVGFCPEVVAGMSVPRKPMELLGEEVFDVDGNRVTSQFLPLIQNIEHFIKENSIIMALMKEKSPSCGVGLVYDGTFSGKVVKGQGIVSREISKYIPIYSENELLVAKKHWNQL